MNKKSIWKASLMTLLGAIYGTEKVTLADYKTEDGDAVLMIETIEEGAAVLIKGEAVEEGEESNDIPAPDGVYKLENGQSITTEAGVIVLVEGEASEKPAEEKPIEEAPTEEAAALSQVVTLSAEIEAKNSQLLEIATQLSEAETKLSEIESRNSILVYTEAELETKLSEIDAKYKAEAELSLSNIGAPTVDVPRASLKDALAKASTTAERVAIRTSYGK